jgi:dolichol-phosphate mannosyltransferase
MWSIVVPVFNEQQSLHELVRQVSDILGQQPEDFEILLIDDGSTDESWRQIESLSESDNHVRGVKFRRNFGKAAALSAGFERARGDILVTMDADLQDDPEEIPKLIGKLEQGYDVVSGWKRVRHDPWHKVWPSRIFNWLISKLTGVKLHDHNCGLKAYRKAVLEEVQLYGEMHRFVPVLAAARGFRVAEVPVKHKPREYGKSKYGVERFVKGFLDLLTVYFLTGYSHRPQHLLGSVGLISFGSGAMGLLILSIMWVISRLTEMSDLHLHEKAIFYFCIVALLFGAQLISIGFLAELITAQNRPARRPYSIQAETDASK